MRQMLDKELPEKKRKNRLMLWFKPLLLGLGLSYYYTFTNSSNDHSPTQSKRAGDIVNLQTREEVNPPIVVETPNHEPITTNLSLHKEESIKTAPVERELKKNKKIYDELTDEERFEWAGLSSAWNRIKESIKQQLKEQNYSV